MKHHESFDAVRQFDVAPDAMLLDIPTVCAIAGRSRASIYRHFTAGDLTPVKVGNSTRIKVGELRRLIGASTATAQEATMTNTLSTGCRQHSETRMVESPADQNTHQFSDATLYRLAQALKEQVRP